jgi:hypothetical protein
MNSISINERHILTKKLLTEDLLTRSNVLDANWRPTKPWDGDFAQVEKQLKKLGAMPFPGDLMNPKDSKAHYELILKTDSGALDRLIFYHSGNVYSGNEGKTLNVKINADGDLELLDPATKDAEGNPVSAGILVASTDSYSENGMSKRVATFNVEVAPEQEESNDVLDTIQLILDFAGLIPGIGDAIDVINALIYFARGKVLDGFLSLIAIIPLVGSVISLTLKTALKPLKWIGKALTDVFRGAKNADEIWLAIKETGKISPEQLKLLAEGMQKFGDDIAGLRGWLSRNNIPGLDERKAAEILEQFENFCRSNTRSIDDLLGASQRTGKAIDASRTAFKTGRKVGEFAYKPLRNVWNRARKIGMFPEKKIKQLSVALDLRFMRRMKADPKRLASILSTTPNAKAVNGLKADLMQIIETRIASLPNGTQELNRLYQNVGRTTSDPDAWIKTLDYVKNNPAMTNLYDEVGSKITNFAMANDNVMYNMYRTGATQNIEAVLSTKDMTATGILQSLDFSWRKNADILWNELQDMGEDAKIELGLSEKDDINGLFYPILKVALDNVERVPVIGEPLGKVRNVGKNIVKQAVQIPVLGGIARKVAGGSEMPYVPKDYKVVDDDDPRLKNQEEETETRKKNVKRFF